MKGQAMNGKNLMNAARIVARAGEQIEALMEILNDKLKELLNEKESTKASLSNDSEKYSEGDWVLTSYLWDFKLLKKRGKLPFAHVGLQVILYDENEAQIDGWEPSIYVMFDPSKVGFELKENYSFWLSRAMEEECTLYGERLWRWSDEDEKESGWAFVLPLVRLNSEEDLVHQIVEPVSKLLDRSHPADQFPEDSVAFRFFREGDELRILSD